MKHILCSLIIVLTLLTGAVSYAQNGQVLTVDLAEGSVDITTGFNGAKLVLFGAKEQPGDLAIVVSGPRYTMVVRHKEKIGGIWMNSDSIKFRDVPVYYDFALSVPERELSDAEQLRKSGIGLGSLRFIYTGQDAESKVTAFREALIRNKQSQGHYPLEAKKVVFLNENFFRTEFYLPPDVPTGYYVIHSYLFRDGEVVDRRETQLNVAQVGFSARLYNFAYNHSWIYGFLAIFLAMLAGILAYVFLKRK